MHAILLISTIDHDNNVFVLQAL